jgi:hypothetical protein
MFEFVALKMQNIDALRREYARLCKPNNINDCLEVVDIYSEFFTRSILSSHPSDAKSAQEGEAKLIQQMMLTKCLHLKSILPGTSFISKRGDKLPKIVDPTIVACLVRNVYETIALFNLIYKQHSGDSRDIVYKLWVISGLKYRQRFESNIRSENYRKKQILEKGTIEKLTTEIENNHLFLSFSEEVKQKIKNCIKQKVYLVKIENNNISMLSWQQMINIMGLRKDLFSNLYNYFSLYAHPTNVSVFQFGIMFERDEKNVSLAKLNMQYLFSFCAIFIADYITLFSDAIKIFESLNILEQAVINGHYSLARGGGFQINEAG